MKCVHLCMGNVCVCARNTYPLFHCRQYVFIIIINIIILNGTFFSHIVDIYIYAWFLFKMQLYKMHQRVCVCVCVLNTRIEHGCVRAIWEYERRKYVCFGIIIICNGKGRTNGWIYFYCKLYCNGLWCMGAWCVSWVFISTENFFYNNTINISITIAFPSFFSSFECCVCMLKICVVHFAIFMYEFEAHAFPSTIGRSCRCS